MRGCEVIWDEQRADQMEAMVERAVGGPCPCRVGNACPLLPTDVRLTRKMDVPPPRLRVLA